MTFAFARAAVAAAVAACISVPASTPASAAETTLIFATLDQPQAHLIVHNLRPWAEHLNAVGKGVLRIDERDGFGVASHQNVYSRVMNDVIQIGWGLQSSVPGKFKLTEVVTLPFLADRSAVASVALWRLYKSGMFDAEYDESVMLKCNVFPQSGMQFRSKPGTLDNLNGKKMIAGGHTMGKIVEAQGGAPLTMLPPDIYPALQRGVADGVMIGWTAFQPFKLAEVTKYHVEISLGGASGMVFMAKKKYEALPADAKKLIDSTATEAETRKFGEFWDKINDDTAAQVKGMAGHDVVKPTASQLASWRKRMASLTDEWVKATPGGDKVLAKYKELLAQVAKGS
jgi:TRAP-type C4-dicarboxylate transport system substrate-binding protein